MRDSFGEWRPGQIAEFQLRASVQPLRLEDAELAGGSQLVHRLKVYALPRRERIGFAQAVLLWNGDPLTWNGDPLTWGLGAEFFDEHAIAAAFENAGADRVRWQGVEYVVESSETWPRYTKAVLLRET